jgi:membrane protein DedA with SNARE-associated domain/membrane-associated phospholipid phosphatase
MRPGQVFAAIVAAVIFVWIARRRRKLSRERLVLGLLAAAVLIAYAAGAFDHLPSFQKMIEDLANALGKWTYALVGVFAFLETGAFVGLIAPGEFTVIVGGVIAGQGTIDVIPLLALVWVCCIAGDTTSFFVGRRLGRPFLERHGPRFKITHERLDQVEDYFHRHGGKTILIGRFIGLVRAVAPFIAGASGIRYARFIPYSVLGTGLWSAAYTLLGYVFYRSFEQVAGIAGKATLAFGIAVALVVGAITIRRRRDEVRAWLERKPVLRTVMAKGIDPAWRLIQDRLTIELVTALAVAAAGLFVFVGYAIEVGGSHVITPGDRSLHDLAADTYSLPLKEIALVLSGVGSLPATVTVVVLAGVALAFRRRLNEMTVLIVGFVVVYAVVHITKGAIDRPRPPDPLTGSSGSAYPSGHAAYSTVYVAVAVIASRVRGLASSAALIVAGTLLATAIGGSRIYLRVHWWSDVAGGWGLGLGVFATLGAIALVVDAVRHNERVDVRAG